MNSSGIRKKVLACVILFLTISFPFMVAWADEPKAPEEQKAPEAAKPSATISTDILSQYIFRGSAQSKDSAVFQPSFTVTYAGFSANVWGNWDTARHSNNPFMPLPSGQQNSAKWSETDFTVSYTKELCKDFSVLIGNVYYGLQNPISPFDQDEVFGGVTYNFPWFSVAFTTYGEVTHSVDVWFQLDLTKSIPVDMLCKGATLDFGASFGYLILLQNNNTLDLAGNTGTYSDFHTCQLTADVKFPVNKYLTVSPKVGVWLPLTDAASNFLEASSLDSNSTHFYGGINLTATF
ncbi:MAG: TorF family putative porin [Syntrophobacteraceae bacterium]